MNAEELKLIVPYLREQNVQFFRYQGVEIGFFKPVGAKTNATSPTNGISTEKIDDVVVPQSIEEEMKMTAEQILNWGVDGDVRDPLSGMTPAPKEKAENNG